MSLIGVAGDTRAKNEGGDLGTPYVFTDNSGFLLSGGDDRAFPAIESFSAQEIAELQAVWARAKYLVIDAPNEIKWLEKHVAGAEADVEKGSKFGPERLAEAHKEIAAVALRDVRLKSLLLARGLVLSEDAQGDPTIAKLPGYENAAKDMQQQLAEAVANFLLEKSNRGCNARPRGQKHHGCFRWIVPARGC